MTILQVVRCRAQMARNSAKLCFCIGGAAVVATLCLLPLWVRNVDAFLLQLGDVKSASDGVGNVAMTIGVVSSLLVRFLAPALLMFFVVTLFQCARYHMKLVAHLESVGDALALADNNVANLQDLIEALNAKHVGFEEDPGILGKDIRALIKAIESKTTG